MVDEEGAGRVTEAEERDADLDPDAVEDSEIEEPALEKPVLEKPARPTAQKPKKKSTGPRQNQRSPKARAARRIALREAAAKRAAEQRRNRIYLSVLGSVVGVIVLVAAFVVVRSATKDEPADPTVASSNDAGPAAGPKLPADANPALKQKPEVKAGQGELTKLDVQVLIPGTGDVIKAGQTITVNYVGVGFKDGKEFDSSWSRGQPASFEIGTGKVIKGWDQGIPGQKIGSRLQLDIPADLAYGDSGGSVSGPLRFVVDILGVGDAT
jgi:peptidylprolyl isomerase